MSTYAQIADFEAYTELTINTPVNGLQKLMDDAERDIDRVIQVYVDLTDSIQGISLSNVTGGTFSVSVPWGLYTYTTAEIPWNVDGDDFVRYMNDMTDTLGNRIPAGSWGRPQGTYSEQQYAYGPLPGTPIVFEAMSQLGSQALPLVSFDTTMLDGSGAAADVAQMVGGGLKVDPYQLAVSDMMALRRATCAQAEYRDQIGQAFFTMPQFMTVSGPEFNTTGRRPRIGPRVMDELASTDLIQRGARASISTRANRSFAYMPIGDLGIPDDWRAI